MEMVLTRNNMTVHEISFSFLFRNKRNMAKKTCFFKFLLLAVSVQQMAEARRALGGPRGEHVPGL